MSLLRKLGEIIPLPACCQGLDFKIIKKVEYKIVLSQNVILMWYVPTIILIVFHVYFHVPMFYLHINIDK